jgi:glutaminyl-peptide cyclotransferase
VQAARLVAAYPHDPEAFTQGLFWKDGLLFESTGLEGRSTVRKVELESGGVVASTRFPDDVFGEGIAPWGEEVVAVTWQGGVGFRWSAETLEPTGTFRFSGEGWGLASDGDRLILSDGTPLLRFLDAETCAETGSLRVTAGGQPLPWLNALQWVEGEILANVLTLPAIARIDPVSGRVTGWIDLRPFVFECAAGDPEKVANGIAWDADERRLFVTGKNWPRLYQLELPPPLR